MSIHIWFIVITYHPDNSLFHQKILQIQPNNIIISDNAGLRKNSLSNTEILHNPTNLGFTGGANAGIRRAVAMRADWVVVMNYDLSVTKKSISQFNKILEKSAPGVVGPFAGKLDPMRWTTIFPSKTADYISGSCIAIHKNVIESIGLFHDPYFIYYEDADFCIRARRAGFPVMHVPIAGIEHKDSSNPTVGAFRHEYYLARNHLLFVERSAPSMVRAYEYVRLPKTIAEHILKGERGALLGIRDYFLRKFGTCNQDH